MDVADDEREEGTPIWKKVMRVSFLLALLTLLILAIVFSDTTTDIAESFLNWVEDNPALGAFVFILIYLLATVLFFPGLILTIGAGIVFGTVLGQGGGLVVGTLVVFAGAVSGATIAFLIARFVLRESILVYASKYEKFGVIDRVVAESGFKVTVLLRLAPVIPFNAFNYAMGVTGVSLRDYCMAHIGMLPGTIAYVFVGTTIGSIADASSSGGVGDNPGLLALLIGGSVVGIIGVTYIAYVAKKEFAKIAARDADRADAEEADREAGVTEEAAITRAGSGSSL